MGILKYANILLEKGAKVDAGFQPLITAAEVYQFYILY
jgi:hypothetical protein